MPNTLIVTFKTNGKRRAAKHWVCIMRKPYSENLVRKLKASGQNKAISNQQIKRCVCDCPLVATIDFGGQKTCSYHFRQDYRYWAEITMAINNNLDLIRKHALMTRWTPKDWSEQFDILSQFYLCQMTEIDRGRPTYYLNKFRKAIAVKIFHEASEPGGHHS